MTPLDNPTDSKPAAASPIKVEHINPFIAATRETFKLMMQTEILPGKIRLANDAHLRHDVSGIIGLSGDARGTIALSFPKLSVLKTVSKFIGEKVVTVDDVVKDAVGELANIVAGAAKKDLTSFKISISLPTVVVGEGHEVCGGRDIIPLAVPFDSHFGPFSLIVGFLSEKPKATTSSQLEGTAP